MREMRASRFVVLYVAGVLAVVACSSSDSNDNKPACVPGATQVCTGPGACAGSQVCVAGGTGWGDCICAPAADASTQQTDSGELDAASEASSPDADSGGLDAASDASVDADAEVPRFGVNFSGQNDTGVYAPLSTDLIGKTSITMEAYFRLNAATDRGLIFQTPNAYCAVTTTGALTGAIHCCAPQNNLNPCVEGPAKANLGSWYHVAWVFSGGNWTLYVNGTKQGDVPSVYQSYPVFVSPPDGGKSNENNVFFGVPRYITEHAVAGTVDEFRLTYSALYTADFTPPKHLDAPGALNLMFDEGTGTTSGTATLFGSTSWVTVSR